MIPPVARMTNGNDADDNEYKGAYSHGTILSLQMSDQPYTNAALDFEVMDS